MRPEWKSISTTNPTLSVSELGYVFNNLIPNEFGYSWKLDGLGKTAIKPLPPPPPSKKNTKLLNG